MTFSISPSEVESGDFVYADNSFFGSADTIYPSPVLVVREMTSEERTLLEPTYIPADTTEKFFWVTTATSGASLTVPLSAGNTAQYVAASALMGLIKVYADRETIAAWLAPVTSFP